MIFMLDDVDRRILRLMQADPDVPLPNLAETLGMTVGRLGRRLDKLRDDGVLLGQEALYSVQVK